MNGSAGSLAFARSRNLRYLPKSLACEVTQMSAERLRSVRKLRSKLALISGYSPRDKAAGSVRLQILTASSSRSPWRTGNENDVQPGVWPAVTCAVSSMDPEAQQDHQPASFGEGQAHQGCGLYDRGEISPRLRAAPSPRFR